jgi:hypothetical protein
VTNASIVLVSWNHNLQRRVARPSVMRLRQSPRCVEPVNPEYRASFPLAAPMNCTWPPRLTSDIVDLLMSSIPLILSSVTPTAPMHPVRFQLSELQRQLRKRRRRLARRHHKDTQPAKGL